MGRRRAKLLLAFAATAVFLGAANTGASSRKADSWKTHVDQAAGFRVDIPAGWQVVPRTVSGVQARIKQLRTSGRKGLADQFAAIIGDPYTRKQVTQFRFFAFQWPALPSPINTDVNVKISSVPASFHEADLATVGEEIAKTFKGPGDRVEPVTKVRLPAGPAVRVRGVSHLGPRYKGVATGFTAYLLLRPRRLFLLTFRLDSRFTRSQRPVLESIAGRFAFLH